jgi:hypothetical protein
VLKPGEQLQVAFLGVGPVANISPFAEGSLDEAFGFSVGARGVGPSEAVANAESSAGVTEPVGAIATSVVGKQGANGDAVLGIKSNGVAQESEGSFGFLVGQQLGEGEAGVIIDGDMERLPAGVLPPPATSSIATNGNLLIARHSLDVEMQQISRKGVFITHHGWGGMQIAPAIETSAPQDAADGGGTQSGGLGDLIAGAKLATEFEDASD